MQLWLSDRESISGRWPRSKKKGPWEPQFGFTQPFWPSRRIMPTFFCFLSSKTHSSHSPQYFFRPHRSSFLPRYHWLGPSVASKKSSSHRKLFAVGVAPLWNAAGNMNFTWLVQSWHSSHVQHKTHRRIQIHQVWVHDPVWPKEPAGGASAWRFRELQNFKKYKN